MKDGLLLVTAVTHLRVLRSPNVLKDMFETKNGTFRNCVNESGTKQR